MSSQMSDASQIGAEIEAASALLQQAENMDQYLEQVFQIFDMYGLGHGCLHAMHRNYSPSQALWRVTPDEVTEACSYLIEKENHPAIILGKGRHFPFNMFQFREQFEDDQDIQALYEAFELNGVVNAYGLPIQTAERGTFVFVVARPGSPIETVELLTLQAICSNAVNGIQQFTDRVSNSRSQGKLADSERDMLLAIANGATITTISEKLRIGELTVRLKVDHIIEKLSAQNVSHAIVLMLIEGEIALEEISSSRLQ
ncbi:MAG: LuxR C-terminal-related transcriptional regulator [Rhizobiaceae bacterium]